MAGAKFRSDPEHPGRYVLDETNQNGGEVDRRRLLSPASAWRPPTDVYETPDALVVLVEIAGMRESDLTLELDGQTLTICGLRNDIAERGSYHQMEIRFGEFRVALDLPFAVILPKIVAEYQQGLLRVSLPRLRPFEE